MEESQKTNRSAGLWGSWHEDYTEIGSYPEIWQRWSYKVKDQLERLQLDEDAGLPEDVIEGRISVIESLFDDLKLYSKVFPDGKKHMVIGKRFA